VYGDGRLELQSCSFALNSADFRGGGGGAVWATAFSQLSVRQCAFTGHRAQSGAVLYVAAADSSTAEIALDRVLVLDARAGFGGGALFLERGVRNPVIRDLNVTVVHAALGGIAYAGPGCDLSTLVRVTGRAVTAQSGWAVYSPSSMAVNTGAINIKGDNYPPSFSLPAWLASTGSFFLQTGTLRTVPRGRPRLAW
jgi:hypothetical protein